MAHNGRQFLPVMPMFRYLCAYVFATVLAFTACTTMNRAAAPEIPEGAEQVTRTESNGDRITEYRINGQLRMLYVVPRNGPAYYLYDRGGRPGSTHDNPPQTYFKLFGW